MLYKGDTVYEAVSKALGRRRFKQDDINPHGTPEAIARGRARAAEEVYDYMVRERTFGDGKEFGCYCVYNTRTGQTRFVNRFNAGTPYLNWFRFTFAKQEGEVWGANGHSHPAIAQGDRDYTGPNTSRGLNEQNSPEERVDLNHDDDDLLRAGVVVIKLPSGTGGSRNPQPTVIWGTWSGREYFNR